MVELSGMIKFSLFILFFCPIVSIIVYLSPWWKNYVNKFDNMGDMDNEQKEEK